MSEDFKAVMRRALGLTRSGQWQEATQWIQAALRQSAAHASTASTADTEASASAPTATDVIDVIDVLAREVPEAEPAPSAADEPAPPRSTDVATGFFPGHYVGSAGQLPYKLFVPPGAGTRPMPLVVMLHGCTQDPDDFAAGTAMNEAAAAQGFFVLYPAQSAKANPQRCWNWFKHNHQARGRGEPAILAGMTNEIIKLHGIDPDQVYVAGLSAGGAMAAILGSAYPDIYAAVGVHSGLAAGSASDLPSALAAMQGAGKPAPAVPPNGMPTIVFHGDSDTTVHPGNGARVIAGSAPVGASVDRQTVQHGPGGRTSTRVTYRAPDGDTVAEHWIVHGSAHAWSGGRASGSYTDPRGPNATAAMLAFFFRHRRCGGHAPRSDASCQV